ncbi:MAG: RteC domain-containing protein [Bacteroidetes bacterium]|nr:RteC domain-containing protein [Bacteroidota bacterium]MBS1977838.1 RteC domain-containing protein [Bacteroidota bacterium]
MKTIDINTYSTQLQDKLRSRIEAIAGETTEFVPRSSKCLVAIQEVLTDLKQFVYKYEFQSRMEEVEFFKDTKPTFLSQYYYYDSLVTMKISEPVDQDRIRFHYIDELGKQQEFVRANQDFYIYCVSGATHFDEQYFTRGKSLFKAPDLDTRFSTGHDNILARILANHMIRAYVDKYIKQSTTDPGISSLKWTAKKADLVELIYALHEVKVFNDGKVDIKQIANLFENLFNVSLGNFYRHFQEIGLRKGGRTNFIDHLKNKLEQRLDENL